MVHNQKEYCHYDRIPSNSERNSRKISLSVQTSHIFIYTSLAYIYIYKPHVYSQTHKVISAFGKMGDQMKPLLNPSLPQCSVMFEGFQGPLNWATMMPRGMRRCCYKIILVSWHKNMERCRNKNTHIYMCIYSKYIHICTGYVYI